jgi:hypothetical protein
MKSLLRSLLAEMGYELCRLSPLEAKDLPPNLPMNDKETHV